MLLQLSQTVTAAAATVPSHPATAAMSEQDMRRLIDDAIRQHELRVALWSGLAGALLLGGTWHAILMCR
jgi:hypothetical protein